MGMGRICKHTSHRTLCAYVRNGAKLSLDILLVSVLHHGRLVSMTERPVDVGFTLRPSDVLIGWLGILSRMPDCLLLAFRFLTGEVSPSLSRPEVTLCWFLS
jgi:hypothetical protein